MGLHYSRNAPTSVIRKATHTSASTTTSSCEEASKSYYENNNSIIQRQLGNRLSLDKAFLKQYEKFMPEWSLHSNPMIVPEMEAVIRQVCTSHIAAHEEDALYHSFNKHLNDKESMKSNSNTLVISQTTFKSLLSQFKRQKGISHNYFEHSSQFNSQVVQVAQELLKAISAATKKVDLSNAKKRVHVANKVCRALLKAIMQVAGSEVWTDKVAVSFLALFSFGMYLMMPTLLNDELYISLNEGNNCAIEEQVTEKASIKIPDRFSSAQEQLPPIRVGKLRKSWSLGSAKKMFQALGLVKNNKVGLV